MYTYIYIYIYISIYLSMYLSYAPIFHRLSKGQALGLGKPPNSSPRKLLWETAIGSKPLASSSQKKCFYPHIWGSQIPRGSTVQPKSKRLVSPYYCNRSLEFAWCTSPFVLQGKVPLVLAHSIVLHDFHAKRHRLLWSRCVAAG